MTIRKAVSVIQSVLQPTVYEMQKRHDPVANELDKAWIVVREIALKTENNLSDEGTTTAWMNMPESPNDEGIENFIHNTKTWLCSLNRKTNQCETDISMLWDAVEAIRNRLPKEWGK